MRSGGEVNIIADYRKLVALFSCVKLYSSLSPYSDLPLRSIERANFPPHSAGRADRLGWHLLRPLFFFLKPDDRTASS